MEHTPEYYFYQALISAQQWIMEAPTPEAKEYRMQESIRILSSKEPIMHYYRDDGFMHPPPMPAENGSKT